MEDISIHSNVKWLWACIAAKAARGYIHIQRWFAYINVSVGMQCVTLTHSDPTICGCLFSIVAVCHAVSLYYSPSAMLWRNRSGLLTPSLCPRAKWAVSFLNDARLYYCQTDQFSRWQVVKCSCAEQQPSNDRCTILRNCRCISLIVCSRCRVAYILATTYRKAWLSLVTIINFNFLEVYSWNYKRHNL
jgi:hypothetical protein